VESINLSRQSERTRNIIDWFSKTDYSLQLMDFLGRIEDGSGQWLLDTPEFRSWLAAKGKTLFCPGIPGAGKTILASAVISFLQKTFAARKDVGIAFAYCNFKRRAEQTASSLISSLLRQLLLRRTELLDDVESIYESC